VRRVYEGQDLAVGVEYQHSTSAYAHTVLVSQSDNMPLKQCCATGSLHTGTPQGRIQKLHGLDCYVADAPSGSPKGIVVIIPDAFGWELPNNKILADEYAKKGDFQVVR
jgi:hypothetical protein